MTHFVRTWRIDSDETFRRVLGAMSAFKVDFERHPMELILREEYVEKTHDQRKLFHAICNEAAPLLSLTPRATKLKIKADFYGVEVIDQDGVIVAVVPSSESSDREEYSRLIDHAYQFCAEAGVFIPDRRKQ